MEREIKTRGEDRKLKVLNKAENAAVHMKRAYVSLKENEKEHPKDHPENPSGYAQNQVEQNAQKMGYQAAIWMKQQGCKAIQHTKLRGKETAKETAAGEGEVAVNKMSSDWRAQGIAEKMVGERQTQKNGRRKNLPEESVYKPLLRVDKEPSFTGRDHPKMGVIGKKAGQGAVKEKPLMQQGRQLVRKTFQKAKRTREASHAAAKMAIKTGERTAKVTTATVKGILAAARAFLMALASGGWVTVLIIVIVLLFGGALSMIGGSNSSTALPVSAEVEAYTPLLRQYAAKYGIAEYVDLLKAVMMQESGGRGLDPMQSSEGGFNTRYPRQPNGITDPEYSISCGVQELEYALRAAKVESPLDMEHIKLALQGYNFGSGYIGWAIQKEGGYTQSNANEYSDLMAAKNGWSSYGDKQYVQHVLRYYPFGRIPTGMGNTELVQVALSQEGNQGGQPYWSWYGFNSRVEWCACFVSWCAEQCGYLESGIIPRFSLCSDGVQWFRQRGQWQDGSYTPKAGDIIFFDWGTNGSIDHVGIVVNVTDGVVNTIEGNSGDACRQRSYGIGSGSIYGYGIPLY